MCYRWHLVAVTVLLAGCQPATAQSVPCLAAAAGWQQSYAADIGFCYYFRDAYSRKQVNYSTALQDCPMATNVTNLSAVRLSRLADDQQRTLTVQALIKAGIGYWNIWTEASCNLTSERFEWGTGAAVKEMKLIACNSSVAAQFVGSVEPLLDGSYKVNSHMESAAVTGLGTTVCEYDVPQCNMSTLAKYNSSQMQPDATPLAARELKAACAPGYYRQSEVDNTADSKWRNKFKCRHIGSPNGIGIAQLEPVNNSVVDPCKKMHCGGGVLLNLSLQVDFKETYRNLIDPNREYLFGEFIPVECKTGYVKITNQTNVNSTIDCRQNVQKPNEGQWDPIFCTPVPCNRSAISGAYDVNTMQMYKAYNRLKDHTYSPAETHLFSYYPNTVYIRCSTSGQFFKDRKYDKTFQCNLLPNSTLEAAWYPVEGTLESSMQCQPITCLTNELVARSYRDTMQEYLLSGKFNSSVLLSDDTGLITNATLKDFLSASEYKYTVAVRFACQYGYAMSTVNDTDGKIISATSLQSQCSSTGSWNKIISECIKLSASIDATSGKRFEPEPKEAGSAQSLGAIVIVILVVFFSLIVVLDIATLSRDIKLLKQNLRRLRLKTKMRGK